MLSWKNTKCREQQTQSITITTPAAGEESMNCFGLLPACSSTWENTHSPEARDFIPSHSTLHSPSPKSFMEHKSPCSCSGQKLSKEERGVLHRGTGLPGMSWHLRKVLSPSKVLLTPHTLLTSPALQSFILCGCLPIPVAGLGLLLPSSFLKFPAPFHPSPS